jgi:hypothetical protein
VVHVRIGLAGSLILFLTLSGGCARDPDGQGASVTALPAPAQGEGVPVLLDLVWCVKVNASASEMIAFANRIQACADALWNATHGQMAVRQVILVDQCPQGHVVLENLGDQWAGGQIAWTYRLAGERWEMHLGGAFPMQVWLHEIGHAEVLKDWGQAEEYAGISFPIPCAMGAWDMSSGEGEVAYCDAGTCLTARSGCWEHNILPTHPDWTYPRTPGPPPPVTVILQDNP